MKMLFQCFHCLSRPVHYGDFYMHFAYISLLSLQPPAIFAKFLSETSSFLSRNFGNSQNEKIVSLKNEAKIDILIDFIAWNWLEFLIDLSSSWWSLFRSLKVSKTEKCQWVPYVRFRETG